MEARTPIFTSWLRQAARVPTWQRSGRGAELAQRTELVGCFLGPGGRAGVLDREGQRGGMGKIQRVVSFEQRKRHMGHAQSLVSCGWRRDVCKHEKVGVTRSEEGWARNWDLSVNAQLL